MKRRLTPIAVSFHFHVYFHEQGPQLSCCYRRRGLYIIQAARCIIVNSTAHRTLSLVSCLPVLATSTNSKSVTFSLSMPVSSSMTQTLANGNCSWLIRSRIPETPLATIEETFSEFTRRKDIAIILINQHVSSWQHQQGGSGWVGVETKHVYMGWH